MEVNAGHDDVELGEGFFVEIHGAVGEDVALDAGEDVDASFHLVVNLPDAGGVGEGARVVHAVGHGEELGVVGDGDVAAAAEDGGFGHFADGAGAVGLMGVHVDVAVEVGEGDKVGKGVRCGGFELAAVFAELGGDVVEAERVVDFGFGFRRDDAAVVDAGEGIFGKGEALLEGALAQGYVVVFGAGEVLEGGAVGGTGEEADVDLEVVAEGEGDLVLAAGVELVDEGESGDVFDGGGDDRGLAGRAGGKEVEVADGFAAAAERAGGSDGVDAGKLEDEVSDGGGVVAGLVDAEAGRVAAVVFDAFEEFFGKLGTHAGELGEVAGLGGGFELIDGGDLERGPDEGDGFGPHAGQAQELEHGGAVLE